MSIRLRPTTLIHQVIQTAVMAKDKNEGRDRLLIDATAGRGHDTAFLCGLAAAKGGRVLAFDIQAAALDSTAARLEEGGYSFRREDLAGIRENSAELLAGGRAGERSAAASPEVTDGPSPLCRLILDSHEHLAAYAAPDSADAVMFNLGYLPGGDHRLFTRPETSIRAITAALTILKPGGLVSLGIYHGGDSGDEERDALLPWLSGLDQKRFTVLRLDFANWTGDVPIPVFIVKQ